MAELPPPSSPSPPNESDNSDPPNPTPNPNSSDQPLPQTPEPQNPVVDLPNPAEEPQIVADDQDQDDPEAEQEGMNVNLSPPPHTALESKGNPPPSSSRRQAKRKKGFGKKSQVALEKKLQTLSQNFNPIPFVPEKNLDFSRHEELLKKVGLWDFAHTEFDRSLRADLIAQLVVRYVPKQRYVYVNSCRISVNRADLGRALKLPGKKTVGDCEGEVFSAEFLVFLEEFVSNWMLLHEDSWIIPTEIVNVMGLIKGGNLEKVDWAGLVWFMVEKELAQGPNLKDCYYASHLQQLIKMQKEELLKENEHAKVDLTVDDDDDGGDVMMLDSDVGQKSEGENVEVRASQDEVAPMEIAGDDGKEGKVDDAADSKVENVDDTEKMDEGGDTTDKVEKVEDDGEKVENVGEACDAEIADKGRKGENVGDPGNSEEVCNVVENQGGVHEDMSVGEVRGEENVGDANDVGTTVEVGKVENVEGAECVGNVESTDDHVGDVDKADEHVENVDNADEQVENVDHADEHMENVDNVDEHVDVLGNNTENVEEGKDVDMMDFGYCKGDEQGQWLLDGKNESGPPFLQRCSVTDSKLSLEDGRQVGLGEGGIKHEVVDEDDEHVEGFRITQKSPLDGIPQANLMQAFETGQLQYSPADHGGQTSLQLMSSRVENNVMLGGPPTMFNHVGKREIDHDDDIAHHGLNDNHKKMRMDGSWGHQKPSDFDIYMEQILHLVDKAKMAHEAEKEEAYDQGNMNQQYMNIAHEIARKDNEIMQLKCKLEEVDRRRQAEINRLDRELYLMNSVINGYRSALKDTQRAFAEFRKRCAVPDEPVYKDAGSGGVVKSIAELERERVKQEQERKLMCSLLEEAYVKQMKSYDLQWETILVKVQSLDTKLQTAADNVELLKKQQLKRTVSENTHNESEDPDKVEG